MEDLKDKEKYVYQLEEEINAIHEEVVDPEDYEQALAEIESHNKAIKGLTSKYNSLEKEKMEIEYKYRDLLKTLDK